MGVVDERSEIGACFQGIPQNDVGLRTDILDCCPKAAGMMMLIRSMAPDVVAVDEIGGDPDLEAAALRDELRLPDSLQRYMELQWRISGTNRDFAGFWRKISLNGM